MSKVTDDRTSRILRNLLIIFPCFYLLFYLLSIIMVGSFHLSWTELGVIPFDFDDFSFENGKPLACWLSLSITFLLTTIILFFVVRSTKNSWDYAITIGFVHLILSCCGTTSTLQTLTYLVMTKFPTNWIWWVTIIVADLLLCLLSELSNYYLRDLRTIIIPE